MSDLINRNQGDLFRYLLNSETGIEIPKPFERDIYLFDTYVAGTAHIEGIDAIAGQLQVGDRLVFYREPENEYDSQAIRIETLRQERIGYVPQQDNVIFSRLMDSGKVLFAKVIEKEKRGNWVKISIQIYLHES